MAQSYVLYNGTGVLQNLTVPFGYIEEDHVLVLVDGGEVSFTWVNPTTVQATTTVGTANVRVKRQTPREALAVFNDGSGLLADDLNLQTTQSRYIAEEQEDAYLEGTLTDLSVDTSKIVNSAVTESKIGDLSVSTGKLATGAVTTTKLGTASVTLAKLADLATRKVIGRTSSGSGVPEEVSPDDLKIVSAGASTERTLASRFADAVNVQDFGAVGDGVTNDGPAINAALVYARNKARQGGALNQVGGKIVLPKARYLIKETISIEPGDILIGEPSGLGSTPTAQAGSGTQIVVSTTLAGGGAWNNSVALTPIDGGPLTVIDICFNGTQTVTNSTWLKSGDGSTNIGLTQSHFRGLRILGFSSAVKAYKFFDSDFTDCGFEANENCFDILGGSFHNVSAVRFSNCAFFASNTSHFVASSAATASGFSFSSCEFYFISSGGKHGILVYDATIKNWSFSSCFMHQETSNTFVRTLDAASFIDGMRFSSCSFEGGSALAIPLTSSASDMRGIAFVNCKFDVCLNSVDSETKGLQFSGNSFVGASTLTITACKNTLVTGNDFGACTGSVFVPNGIHDGLVVNGNIFPAAYVTYGINASSTRTKCSGNVYVADLSQP